HSGRIMQVGPVAPGKRELSVVDRTHDLQQMLALIGGVVLLADGGMRGPVEAAICLLRPRVPLAEVVEHDLRPGPTDGWPFACRGWTQIPERPETEPVAGYGAELPAHRLDQITPARLIAGRDVECDRENGGEPSSGAGEVDALEDVFAAVALEIDRNPVVP